MGSFVNDVFLVKVDNERFVAKRYTNWVSLKWVTLSLYGIGSVRFSISGRRRMEAEYYFNDLLYRRGLAVPKILGADTRNRIVLFTHVLGDQLSSFLGSFAGFPQAGQRERDAAYNAGVLGAWGKPCIKVGRVTQVYPSLLHLDSTFDNQQYSEKTFELHRILAKAIVNDVLSLKSPKTSP